MKLFAMAALSRGTGVFFFNGLEMSTGRGGILRPMERPIIMQGTANRNVLFISFSQFCAATSFSFMYIFLPFYVMESSPYGQRETLLWTGAIMGSTGFILALVAPWAGSLTHRFRPRWLYLVGLIFNTAMCLVMGLTTNLLLLLILRTVQGFAGGLSTIGLIITAVSSSDENRTYHIGIFQSGMALGQLLGPFIGSFAVAVFGYQGAFFSAAFTLFFSFVFCYFGVTDVAILPKSKGSSVRSMLDTRVLAGWCLCVATTTQIMFVPAILPGILQKYGLLTQSAVRSAGTIVMLYTATALVGTFTWSWLSKKMGARRMILLLVPPAIVLQILLCFASRIAPFTILFMLVAGLVAAVVPLTISIFAAQMKGSVIGFLNAARLVGGATGPFLATSVLAFSNLTVLYLVVSGITLTCLLFFEHAFRPARVASPPN
jgi:DHA1 family multidrug resistance protein-like MFS transporter